MSWAVPTTEAALNIHSGFVAAIVILLHRAHTRESHLATPGRGNQKRKETENWGPFDTKQENDKANKTAVWEFLRGHFGGHSREQMWYQSVIKTSISASSEERL